MSEIETRSRGWTLKGLGAELLKWIGTAALVASGPISAVTNTVSAAEQVGSGRLEEIVVTARKRTERLQDVPIAVTVISGQGIRDLGISEMDVLSEAMPNVMVAKNTGTDLISIRGMHSGTNFGFEQTVGQVVDGFFYGQSRLIRVPFLDIQRVEVLRGPQGALIGKNTTAGVINITTAKPTEDFEGWGSVSYDTFDGAGDGEIFEGALSGPLTKSRSLKGRIALRYENGGGYIHNPAAHQDQPDKDDWEARATFTWDPTDNIDITGTYTHSTQSAVGQSKQLAYCSQAMVDFLVAKGIPEEAKLDCGAPNKTSFSLAPRNGVGNFETSKTKVNLGGLTVNWHIGDLTLTSLTGVAAYDTLDRSEGDRTPLEILNTRLIENYQQVSEELRLASPAGRTFEWLAGFYYQHEDLDTVFGLDINLGPRFAPAPAPPPFSQDSVTSQKGDTYAGFAQLTWHINQQWQATVDGRYTREDKDAKQTAFRAAIYALQPMIGPLFHDISQSRGKSDFSPGFSLQYMPTKDLNFYASVRRGFKGGGYNMSNFDPQPIAEDTFQFGDEKVTDYELGAKMILLNDRARINVALYREEFSNLQVGAIDNSTGLAISKIANAAAATSQGVEVEATWLPVENLTLSGSFAYDDATFDKFPNAECYGTQTAAQGCITDTVTMAQFQNLAGSQIEDAPKWSSVVNAQYVWPLISGYSLTGFVQAIYSDKYFMAPNHDPTLLQPAYVKVNASMKLTGQAGRWNWEVSLIARNLTDKITSPVGSNLPGFMPSAYQVFADPGRSFVLKGTLRF